MDPLRTSIDDWITNERKNLIELLQEIIKIPSPSGQERACADKIVALMQRSGFSSSKTDQIGNATGIIKGSGGGRALLMNGHIDHVPPGDMIEPYSGKLMDGSAFGVTGDVVYGRAACDMKASIAAMIATGSALRDIGINLKGDLKVAAVAQEEVGGAGTVATIEREQLLGDVVLVGEATNMDLALGHRGSLKMSVVVKGRSCHASAPERGINAIYKAQDIISRIRDELIPNLPVDALYGGTSLAITNIEAKPGILNVVPEECRFYIDCRNVPDYPAERLYDELNTMIRSQSDEDPDFKAFVLPNSLITGHRGFTGFYTNPDQNPIVGEVESTLESNGFKPKRKTWTFATDGRFYSWLGIPVIGFGPGEERFAHTSQDHVKVEDYLNTIKAYTSIAAKICGTA